MEALPDNLALVLAELEGPVGDGVEEVAAGEVLRDDAALVDPLEIFKYIHYELTLGQFPQQGDLRGRRVLEIIISGVLELTETLSLS